MIPEPLEALGRVFDQLEIKHDFEDERLLTGFGGTNAPYSISIVAWQSAEDWWNFDLRAYIRTGGRHAGSFPLWLRPRTSSTRRTASSTTSMAGG